MGAWRRIVAIALVVLATTVVPAWARPEAEHIRVRLAAPQGCVDEAAFIRALRQRTGHFRLASGTEPARLFLVTIARGASAVDGRLEIHGPGTEVSRRRVTGKTCEGVLAALTFMIALAIDPNASRPSNAMSSSAAAPRIPSTTAPSPAADTPAGSASRTPRPSVLTAPPPPRSATAGSAHRAPATPPVAERRAADPPPSTPEPPEGDEVLPAIAASEPMLPGPTRWQWSAGAHGGVSLHMSPTVGWGGLVFVEAAAPGTAWFGPVLRAGLFVNQSQAILASGAEAKFQWAAALLEGCPLRLAALDARLVLHCCLAFHLGVLRGQGQRLDRPASTTDLWADLGPVVRFRVAVATGFFVETQGMLVLPLRRLSYDVHDAGSAQPPTTMFTVPRLGALAGIGVAYQFR